MGTHTSFPRSTVSSARSAQLACLLALTLVPALAIGCGDDDDTAGSGGSSAGTGAIGGTGGTGAIGGVGGSGGTGGTGGTGATGGSGGNGGTGGTGANGGTGGTGADGGTGGTGGALSRCVAPTPRNNPGNTCTNTPPPAIKLTQLATGLRYPVSIAHAPNDATRIFVVERTGTIRIFRAGALLPTPFLTVSGVVSGFNEQGLLDVAFDPNYATTGHFYVFAIRTGPDFANPYETAVIRYTVSSSDPDVADANSAMPLFTVSRNELNHNGGKLAFGPDGCLYLGLGDGGGSNDQHGPIGNGQDTNQPLGKLLRVDVDNYPTPAPGNLTGVNVYPHIWDYGLRNPWRFSFDRATGDLYIADVGQNTWEEVNVEAAGTGKLNYGWKPMEGMHCRGQLEDGGGCDRTGLTLPVAEYRNPNDGVAIVGGYVYRGTAIPGLQGRYFYADYSSDRIWTFTWDGNAACDKHEVTNQLSLAGATSFGEDSAGELYVVTHGSGQNGRLYRIDPN